ncbi:S8 family serine peptidase [Ekhidna sp. To15]|uniref:S8 family serine peptidase n=1 Tax=Ekhidna sp. To15 TaxID=3395267 RepID=UPI003F5209FC
MLRKEDFKDQSVDEKWIYVKHKPSVSKQAYLPGQKLTSSEKQSSLSGVLRVKVPAGMDPVSYCNKLRSTSPDILYADPIVNYIPLSTPTDALISNQFYLENIRAYDAWDITRGDDDITVAIIDSGIDLDHEDILNNLWVNSNDPIDGIDNDDNGYIDDYYGYDFADSDNDPSIQNGNHGMIVAGIAGASTNNAIGIAGVGYNTKVAALKGFKSANGKSGGLYEAIIYAAENGIDVANLSWGRMGKALQSEQDIISYAALDLDMVLVAAAGNEGGKPTEENRWYPASYDHVLSVGASDASDNKSSGSTFNHMVDLVAPGVSMYSTVNGNGYTNGGPGTSYAAPQVAAAAALVKDQYPTLSAIQIMERIRVTADDIYDVGSNAIYEGKLGKGRLNVLRAVSESGIKSLRAENPTLTSTFGNEVFFGDTVNVSATLTNHLSAINSSTVTISSLNDDFTISNGNFQPGYMGAQDTREISFEIVLNEDIVPETDIEIRLDYSATGYNDFQFLDVTTSPDYADFGNDNLSMTISGDGDLAFNSYDPFEGSGFHYQTDTLMTYAGILLATNSTDVSDNIIANYGSNARNQDFTVQQYYKLYHHPAADHFGYSIFSDINRPLLIEQSNIAWANKDYIIIRYRIVNTSSSAINNLTFGVYADWDIADELSNYAEYDVVDNYIYARNSSSDTFAGVQVIGGDSYVYSALDRAAMNGNLQDVNDAFTDSEKYDFLVNQVITSAGNNGGGNDVATINGITINQLDAYADEFVNVIYAISDSQANLEQELSDAQNQLNDFLLKPRVLQTFSVCAGTSLTIDPSTGDMFEFYEDPLAQDLITTATSYNPGPITSDTVFYVKNVDQSYSSDVFEIRVVVLNDIADFSMSTDTLYLDNLTTNVIQFSDQSLDATSWSWDFDQGTLATIQNPSISFSETGTYTITLEVSNDLACEDEITKDLVVANRPHAPTLSNHIICPGENVVITDPSAEKIRIYAFEASPTPTVSGISITLNSIDQDTTVYVSGVYGSFESRKTPVSIDVMEVPGRIAHAPDTTSTDHQIRFYADGVISGSEVEWTIDGASAGSSTEISIPAVAGTVDVGLQITSPDACVKVLSKEVLISTSPFASQEDLNSCFGAEIEIHPENGTYFGFYEDPELTTLIKKGTQLVTDEYAQLYVVNLDDGLPGMPIQVNVTDQSLVLNIDHTISEIGEKNKVELFVETNDDLNLHYWYINGVLSETSLNPTFFLDDELYEIVLSVSGTFGCSSSDTLLLDFTPPLALEDPNSFSVYPNPSGGWVNFNSISTIDELSLFSLDGKEIMNIAAPKIRMDLNHLEGGLYIIKAKISRQTYEQYLLIR